MLIISVSLAVLWVQQAMAFPRGEFMGEIQRLSVELKTDAQDLLRDAREYGFRRSQGRDFGGSRRGGDVRNDRRGDGGESRREDVIETQRAIRDMRELAVWTSEFNGDFASGLGLSGDLPRRALNVGQSFIAMEAAYDDVLKSFGDASILDRTNVKDTMLRVIKDMALMRFYYDIADGDWSPESVQSLARHLQGAADRLASAAGFREGDIRMAAREFARQARRIGSRGFSRNEDGLDDFRELRRTYENLEGKFRNSNLPDEVVGDALQAFNDFQSLASYYELFPKYRRRGSGLSDHPRSARWTYREAMSLADTIVRKTDKLKSSLSLGGKWSSRDSKDAYNVIVNVSDAAQAFRRELTSRNQSMRETLELVQRLEEKSEEAKRILDRTKYREELMAIDRDIDNLSDLYEHTRGSARGGTNRGGINDSRDNGNGRDQDNRQDRGRDNGGRNRF
jgi:hypothetical protein